MTTEPIALIDMDGTLCDYAGAMERDLSLIAGPGEDTPEDYVVVPDYLKHRQKLIKRQPGWWSGLKFTDFGLKILAMLRKLDFQLHILTKGPTRTIQAWSEKAEWARINVPDASITITEDKGLVYGRVLIDDYPEYVERWLAHRPRGFVVMPAYKYNSSFKHENVLSYRGEQDDDELNQRLEEARNRES